MKRLFNKKFLWLMPLTLLVAGCRQPAAVVPPEIRYGLETCADCGMIINDSHYAAAVAFRAKPDAPVQTESFDDIGCLLAWRQHHAGVQVAATWVKDVNSAAWLNAPSAVYVKNDQLATPMGSGVVAGTTTNDFSKLPVHAPALTWSNLLHTDPMEAGQMAVMQK